MLLQKAAIGGDVPYTDPLNKDFVPGCVPFNAASLSGIFEKVNQTPNDAKQTKLEVLRQKQERSSMVSSAITSTLGNIGEQAAQRDHNLPEGLQKSVSHVSPDLLDEVAKDVETMRQITLTTIEKTGEEAIQEIASTGKNLLSYVTNQKLFQAQIQAAVQSVFEDKEQSAKVHIEALAWTQRANNLLGSLAESTASQEELSEEIFTLTHTISEDLAKAENVEQRLSQHSQNIVAAERELVIINHKQVELEAGVAEFTQELQANQSEIVVLEGSIADFSRRVDESAEQLALTEHKVEVLEEAIPAFSSRVDTFAQRVGNLSDKVDELESQSIGKAYQAALGKNQTWMESILALVTDVAVVAARIFSWMGEAAIYSLKTLWNHSATVAANPPVMAALGAVIGYMTYGALNTSLAFVLASCVVFAIQNGGFKKEPQVEEVSGHLV